MTHHAAAAAGTAPKLHPDMSGKVKNIRESRDNNGMSTPIAVILDETGSMGRTAPDMAADLHKLMKLLLDNNVIDSPQLLFAAVGDAANGTEKAPLQIGEFEVDDLKCEECLGKIYLEGNGGGQAMESYELMAWFFANRVFTDSWEKRGTKGFLFFIADESPYPQALRSKILEHFDVDPGEDVSTQSIFEKLQEQWEVFCIRPQTMYWGSKEVQANWSALIPEERVISQADWTAIVPSIAGTIAVMSGLSVADVKTAMKNSGFDDSATNAATAALVPIDGTGGLVSGSTGLVDGTQDSGATRI